MYSGFKIKVKTTVNMRSISLLLISLTFLVFASCTHEPLAGPEIPVIPAPTDTTDTLPTGIPCDPDTVYFQNQILPLIQSSCAKSGCHDALSQQEGIRLTDYQSIITTGQIIAYNPGSSELYEVITETDPDKIMPPPPYSALTSEQISLIYNWIAQGAKNNYCNQLCDTTQVTYSGTIRPILQTYCIGCHTTAFPSAGIALQTHAELVSNINRVTGSINHSNGFSPMPKNAARLSDCMLSQFDIWVSAGMPNN